MPCDKAELLKKGERTIALERALNYERGFRRQDDHLPKRFMTEPAYAGPTKGKIIDMDAVLDAFYKACHFDPEKAVPTKDHYAELGMEDVGKVIFG
jgi:aldehyde:ferredoxin oxidoreductase